jgi:hypothetical protein
MNERESSVAISETEPQASLGEAASALAGQTPSPTFFDGDDKPRTEVVEGLVREGQLIAFAGPYGMGKSPILADWTVHIIHGIPWCGRQVSRRPVVQFDFETPKATYRRNIKNIAGHLGVAVPTVPDLLDAYLEHDDPTAPATKKLLTAIASPDVKARIDLVNEALSKKPNAFVIVDPLELMFQVDTRDKARVMRLYERLRLMLAKYPCAAIAMTFNLRKRDTRAAKGNLLLNPRDWLEEICGSLDILNRCDVRLGLDSHGDESRVLNGIRRGESLHPLIVRPIEIATETYAGFELCPPEAKSLFTPTQFTHWAKIPDSFRFDEVADKIVPRATLSRIIERARLAGLVEQNHGLWEKRRQG